MKRFFYASFCCFCLCLWGSHAWTQLVWENAGPDNLGYTVRTIAFDASGNLLAGVQGGGLWRSTDKGESWQRVEGYDQAGSGPERGLDPNVTSIATSGNTIVVGTGATAFGESYTRRELGGGGDYDFRTDLTGFFGNLDGLPGDGVYISTDNGATWTKDNATNTGQYASTRTFNGPFVGVQKVMINNGRILMGTLEGLFYSDDNLASVDKASGGEFFQNHEVFDIEIAAGNRIFAVAHDGQSNTDSLYLSTDNGRTFRVLDDPELVLDGRLSFIRTEVAVAPSNPNIVYVATTGANGEVKGVFRKDYANEANPWTTLVRGGGSGFSPLGTSSLDAMVLSVLPNDPNAIILAGFNYYTYSDAEGWVQRAQHTSPIIPQAYIPRNMYTQVFDPSDPNTYYIGTSRGIYLTTNGGESYAPRTKGMEGMATYQVAATYVAEEKVSGESTLKDAIFTSTQNIGIIENHLYNSQLPSRQSFGEVWPLNFSRIAASVIYPGGLLAQNVDGGLVRSVNFGEAFETFYNIPVSPQVANLTPADDTLIDRANPDVESAGLNNNGFLPPQAVFALDEYIPPSLIDNQDLTPEELEVQAPSYIFFCSQNYVWLVQNGLSTDNENPPRWNRITPALVDGQDEVFTAITVSGDSNHTVFVGTNRGNIFRLDRAHDLANFDADSNITSINADPGASLLFMSQRWITDLALDPNQPGRLAVTFGGYGAVGQIFNFLWFTDNAYDDQPVFGNFQPNPAAGATLQEPIYAAHYYTDPITQESILLVGTQSGLYGMTDIILFDGPIRFYLTDEGGVVNSELPDQGRVPVFDIYQRPFRQDLTGGALTRTELRPVNQGDTVILVPFDVARDQIVLTRDQTLYVATHGRGIWTSASLNAQRGSDPTKPITPTTSVILRAYPNPASEQLTLRVGLPAEAVVDAQLIDLQGRTLHQSQYSFQEGWQEAYVDLRHLSPGLYILNLQVQGDAFSEEQTHKIWVSR